MPENVFPNYSEHVWNRTLEGVHRLKGSLLQNKRPETAGRLAGKTTEVKMKIHEIKNVKHHEAKIYIKNDFPGTEMHFVRELISKSCKSKMKMLEALSESFAQTELKQDVIKYCHCNYFWIINAGIRKFTWFKDSDDVFEGCGMSNGFKRRILTDGVTLTKMAYTEPKGSRHIYRLQEDDDNRLVSKSIAESCYLKCRQKLKRRVKKCDTLKDYIELFDDGLYDLMGRMFLWSYAERVFREI